MDSATIEAILSPVKVAVCASASLAVVEAGTRDIAHEMPEAKYVKTVFQGPAGRVSMFDRNEDTSAEESDAEESDAAQLWHQPDQVCCSTASLSVSLH